MTVGFFGISQAGKSYHLRIGSGQQWFWKPFMANGASTLSKK
jgi:hypothetical protein